MTAATQEKSHRLSNLTSAVVAARKISMLAEEALLELARLASLCRGPIIELGPYIGGSTCALAAAENTRVITVELGGRNREHPQLPTDDTIADLEANLASSGVRSRVEIVAGHFGREQVFETVRRHLSGKEAGMLFVDVTPGTEIAVQQYVSLLRSDAYVVIDDYRSDYAVQKAAQVRAFVDRAVDRGFLRELGICGWGTWFGRLTGGQTIHAIRELPVSLPLWHVGGHAWHAFVGHDPLADDVSGNTSPLELFEDDRPLGPSHMVHDTIRKAGLGGYSHWRGELYFSTSDNSCPQTNGRRYSIRVGGMIWDLRGHHPFP
jgi:predicted O-methyltransferase YrrM